MKFIAALFLLTFAFAIPATPQAYRFDPTPVITTNGSCQPGQLCQALLVPGSTIQLCNSYPACSGSATAYTDVTMTTACPAYAPVTLPNAVPCQQTTGPQGQFGFWVGPGQNLGYRVTTPQGQSYVFPFTSPAGGGGAAIPLVVTSLFNFTPQAPGGTLTSGTQTINVSPGITGISGSSGQQVYASGGTGTPGVCTITGGTATSGAPGTLIVNCAAGTSLSGAWTISSATAGASEALVASGSPTGLFTPCGTWNIYGTVNWNGFSGSGWSGDGPCTIMNLVSPTADLITWSAPLANISIGNFSVTSPVSTRTGGWIMHGNCPNDSAGTCLLSTSVVEKIWLSNQYNGFWFAEFSELSVNKIKSYGAWVSGGRGRGMQFGQTAPNSTANQGSDAFISDVQLYGDLTGAGATNLGYGFWIEDCDAVRLGPLVDVGITYNGNVRMLAGAYGLHNHFITNLISDSTQAVQGAGFYITGSGIADQISIDANSWFSSAGVTAAGAGPTGCVSNSAAGIKVDVGTIGSMELKNSNIYANCGTGLYLAPGSVAGPLLVSTNTLTANGKGAVTGFLDGIYVNTPINAPSAFVTGNTDRGETGYALRTSATSNLLTLGPNTWTSGQLFGAAPLAGFLGIVDTTSFGGTPLAPGQEAFIVTAMNGINTTNGTCATSPKGFAKPTGFQIFTQPDADNTSVITYLQNNNTTTQTPGAGIYTLSCGNSAGGGSGGGTGGGGGSVNSVTISNTFTGTESIAFNHGLNAQDGSNNPIVPSNSCTDVTSGMQIFPSAIVPTSANVATITYSPPGASSLVSCYFVF